jgi:hypothetical protein
MAISQHGTSVLFTSHSQDGLVVNLCIPFKPKKVPFLYPKIARWTLNTNQSINENVLKNIFKRGYEEIRDRKLLEILKKDNLASAIGLIWTTHHEHNAHNELLHWVL